MKEESQHSRTVVIYHRADFDGLFCREIARKFCPPDTEFIGWDFGDKPLRMAIFEDGQTIYVMDLPVDRVFGFEFRGTDLRIAGKKAGTLGDYKFNNLVWIDHHKSSIESHPVTIPGYRIDGVAACRLAWQWFALAAKSWKEGDGASPPNPNKGFFVLPAKEDFINREVSEPLAVRLAGEYDIWDHRDNDDDVAFQFGLDSCSPDWDELLQGPEHTADAYRIINHGRIAMACYRTRDAEVIRNRSFLLDFEGLKFLCLNTARCNSNTFAAKDVPETGHDGLLAFYWTGKDWSVSLYHATHRKDLDLSQIAVKFGGGGHQGACGFRAKSLPFLPK